MLELVSMVRPGRSARERHRQKGGRSRSRSLVSRKARRRVAACTVISAVFAVGCASSGWADDDVDAYKFPYKFPELPLISPQPANGYIITLGVQLQGSPKYVGSSAFAPGGAPILNIRRPDQPQPFTAPDDNLEISVLANRSYAFGVVANVDFGRYRDDNPALIGLNKINWAPEAGVFAEFWPLDDRLRLRGELRYGFGSRGFVAYLGADWVQRYGNFTFSFGPRLQAADSGYLNSYFGVTPQQAAVNGSVTPFKLQSGVQFVGVETALRYRWNKSWEFGVFGQYDKLVDGAARSPITKKFGSTDQIIFGINVNYSFRLN